MSATRWKSLHGFALYLESCCMDENQEEGEPIRMKPNRYGLVWKIGKQTRLIKHTLNPTMGVNAPLESSVEEITIMLIDEKAAKDKERLGDKQRAREEEKKREEDRL